MNYKVKVYLPYQKRITYIDELKNKDILTITKYIKANDEFGLSNYLNELLKPVDALTSIDKFFVVLQLRALNLGNTITLKGRHVEGRDVFYKKDIFGFLGEYIKHCETIPEHYTFVKQDLEIIFKHPSNLYYKNFIQLLNDIVVDIKLNNESILVNTTKKEKFNIIFKLKPNILQEIKKFLEGINLSSDLFFIKNESKDVSFPNISISFFNNTLFSIIKSIFKMEISYFYNKFYICLTKLGITYSDYMNLTFIETDILLSIFKSANKSK
jgi:hypothetical protein